MPDTFLDQFTTLWPGGYFEGDPLDPMGRSSYGVVGFNSVLYTTYLACIRPYVTPETVAVEIGPGRGAWTKAILHRNPKRLYTLDVVPAEATRFWEHVGCDERVQYLTVTDFSMAGVPDEAADYFFSFGVFCHLRPRDCRAYFASMARTLAPGANGFLMIADFDKYNALTPLRERYQRLLTPQQPPASRRPLLDKSQAALANADGHGAWYHLGVDEACHQLEAAGFLIVERDIDVNPRDPIIHFRKP
jgi:hypothetical protein